MIKCFEIDKFILLNELVLVTQRKQIRGKRLEPQWSRFEIRIGQLDIKSVFTLNYRSKYDVSSWSFIKFVYVYDSWSRLTWIATLLPFNHFFTTSICLFTTFFVLDLISWSNCKDVYTKEIFLTTSELFTSNWRLRFRLVIS